MARVGEGDAQLGAGLVAVQRERLTEGADTALAEMLGSAPARPELAPVEPVSREPEPASDREPVREPGFERTVQTALVVAAPEPTPPTTPAPVQPVDQQGSREPVLSPTEPLPVSPAAPSPEPREPDREPETDQIEQQIVTLASRLRGGEQLTKTTAAQLLGVSEATGGRRLKDARTRIKAGTGFYP
jgi:hypothetical protein